ncbi:MAG: hypothetical protein Kow0042_01220 [Calditrichia bacterium]
MNTMFENLSWKEILDQLNAIREQQVYSNYNIEFIKHHLQSSDDRVRGGAVLAAEGCILEPQILDHLLELMESEKNPAIRKGIVQVLGNVIHEGVENGLEDSRGASVDLDYSEEWDEIQIESFHENYLRVKNILLGVLQDELESMEIRETALFSLRELGMLDEVREWIQEFADSDRHSARLVALSAMGKFPEFWIEPLSRYLQPDTEKELLLEAISSAYSSGSARLANQIQQLLNLDDPDVQSYALLTLANINRTENLGEILQEFSLHANEQVREAAREAIEIYTNKSFNQYMRDEMGFK